MIRNLFKCEIGKNNKYVKCNDESGKINQYSIFNKGYYLPENSEYNNKYVAEYNKTSTNINMNNNNIKFNENSNKRNNYLTRYVISGEKEVIIRKKKLNF